MAQSTRSMLRCAKHSRNFIPSSPRCTSSITRCASLVESKGRRPKCECSSRAPTAPRVGAPSVSPTTSWRLPTKRWSTPFATSSSRTKNRTMAKRAAGSAPPYGCRHPTQEAPQRELEMTAPAFEPDLCNPTEEHRMLRQTVRDFARDGRRAAGRRARPLGDAQRRALRASAASSACSASPCPPKHGGAGMDAVACGDRAPRDRARADPGFTLAYLAHAMLFVNNFYYAGERRRSARATCPRCSPASGSARWA